MVKIRVCLTSYNQAVHTPRSSSSGLFRVVLGLKRFVVQHRSQQSQQSAHQHRHKGERRSDLINTMSLTFFSINCSPMVVCLWLLSILGFSAVDSFTVPSSVSLVSGSSIHNHKYKQGTFLSLSTTTPTSKQQQQQQQVPQGLTKSITTVGNGRSIRLGDVVTVQYHAYVPTITTTTPDGTTSTVVPITIAQSSLKQKVIVGDGMMIPGWDAALLSMNVGERATVRIEDSMKWGYGDKGVPPLIPPHATLEMDIQILEAEEAPRFVSSSSSSVGGGGGGGGGIEETLGVGKSGSGEWSLLDPSKPRTPETIAAAYKLRQDQAAVVKLAKDSEEPTSTLEQWIEKAKTFYFYGFFEGETGQRAPWFLRPSITFPLAFAMVGAAFYVMVSLGGISERGAQVVDELDKIIL